MSNYSEMNEPSGAPTGEQTQERVQLMTLHKGKGLEFPHVFLPGWEAGDISESLRPTR